MSAVYALTPQEAHAVMQSRGDVREMLSNLQTVLEQAEHPIKEWDLKHEFADGVYMRTLRMRAGDLIVGKIHRHDHANVLQSGIVTVCSVDGRETIEGPRAMISSKGVKRAVYCHTDAVWTTFHANPTNTRDLAQLEALVIAPDYEDLPEVTV